jgi:uncharacterized FlaG/YvyC family protein
VEIGKLANVSELMTVAPVSPFTPQERAQQQQLIRAVKAVNLSQLFGQSTELTYSYDTRARKTVLQIVDKETKEVVRQVPAEYLLQLAQELK